MTQFIAGLELSRLLWAEVVSKLLSTEFPSLAYGAGLLGDGSEVLGFDTPISSDHDWGPRLHLFLSPQDFETVAPRIIELLETSLPPSFHGYPVTFENRDRCIQIDSKKLEGGSPKHGIEVFTVDSFFRKYLATDVTGEVPTQSWLGFPEQILLSLTSGAIFRDDNQSLGAVRNKLSYFPRDIWLYLLASQWTRISQEQAFIGRTGEVGDEIGSAVLAARIVRDIMRLCFLMERKYAPYPKWFGSGFAKLNSAPKLQEHFRAVLSATTWKEREEALCRSYEEAGKLHTQFRIPGNVTPTIGNYHGRPFRVVNADDFVSAIRQEIQDPVIASLPLYGSVNQLSDSTDILSHGLRSKVVSESLWSLLHR